MQEGVRQVLCGVDRIRLDGKVKVLQRGDLETGHTRPLSLFRRGDDPQILRNPNGKPAGRLLLTNVNAMVLVERAKIEVNMHAWLQPYYGWYLVVLLAEIVLFSKGHHPRLHPSRFAHNFNRRYTCKVCNDFARFWLHLKRLGSPSYQRMMAMGFQRRCLCLTQSSKFLHSQVCMPWLELSIDQT